ncbi:MAG: hypothetical protein WC263_02505 [Candidatus Micrarchaeia archaeon]|jgi:hypothetical protein
MLTNQQLKDHVPCPFQGKGGSRRGIVQKLFAQTAASAKKNLRDFACEREAREPYIGASATQNQVTITAYAFHDSIHIGCSAKGCPALKSNGRFFLGVCMDEPAMKIPKRLAHAAAKETALMARGR